MKFSDFRIDERILKAISELGFVETTDIQGKSIPPALEGHDVIGEAMTGSGKTAVFAITIIQKIINQSDTKGSRGVQALVLTPTRELCNQVATELQKFSKHCNVHVAAVYGGVSIEPQIQKIRHSAIVVGTPGRILDHMERGTLSLSQIKILVLDEADRMLDMGFIDDIRRIISQTPSSRQTMLFSATIPEEIVHIAHRYMKNPVRAYTERHVAKHLLKHIYYNTRREEKISLLVHLINLEKPALAIIFTGTRRTADFVDRHLQAENIESRSIHGGHSQSARENILAGFHRGRPHILVATDVAARGLDIKNVTHVFNYDVPKTVEDYTHRIGRTARIGKTGKAITLLSKEDHPFFQSIVKRIDVEKGHLEGFKPKPMAVREGYGDRRDGGYRGGGRGGFGRDQGRSFGRRRRY